MQKAHSCCGCYFEEICGYGPPCGYYTPLTNDYNSNDGLIESNRIAFEKEYNRYLDCYYNDTDIFLED